MEFQIKIFTKSLDQGTSGRACQFR